MIKFENVSLAYDNAEVLKDINLTVNQGDFIAIIGGNGAGKTTMIKLMNRILKPTKGRVLVQGLDTKEVKSSELAKKIGFLFQNPDRQIAQNRIEDEILFGLNCVLKDMADIKRRAEKIIMEFGFDPDENPFMKSRGERQRIALASILAVSPDILILDEPTTGLDYLECMHILNYVKELNEKGTTVIMVSHDMEVVADFSKRIVLVEDGQIIADDSFENVMRNDDVLNKSSVLPSQIVLLAKRLGEGFQSVFNTNEMIEAIDRRRKI